MFVRGFKTWCENTAVAYRRELMLKPVDPLEPRRLAKHLGIVVWNAEEVPGVPVDALQILLREDPWSWSAVTVRVENQSVVIVNSAHSEGRLANDVMHELAHVVLGHDPGRADVSEDGLLVLHSFDRAQEDQANWLAGCLLLPREALIHAQRLGWTSQATATRYCVSVDLVKYRLNVTGVERQLAHRGRRRG